MSCLDLNSFLKDCQLKLNKKSHDYRETRKLRDPEGFKMYCKMKADACRKNPEYIQLRKNRRKIHRLKEFVHNLNTDSKRRNLPERIEAYQLWGILKKQKLICPISGIKLTNENISLDHIIPKSKGGRNTLDNIQFVTIDVNQAKRAHLVSDFLELVNKIYLFNEKKKAGNVTCPPCLIIS